MQSTSAVNIFRNVRPIVHKKSQLSLLEWISKAQIMLRGEPYSFSRHEYLKQIVEDCHPDQVFLKGA